MGVDCDDEGGGGRREGRETVDRLLKSLLSWSI